jgi:hypothetical protein
MYTIRSSKENTNLMKEFDRMSSMKDIVLNNFTPDRQENNN